MWCCYPAGMLATLYHAFIDNIVFYILILVLAAYLDISVSVPIVSPTLISV